MLTVRHWRSLLPAASLCLAILAGGCTPQKAPRPAVLHEKFGSDETYSRLIGATPAQSCEAARRALLSQGYIVVNASAELIDGKKSFQPGPEAHLEMMIRVVCVPETGEGPLSLVFVTAVQDSYTLKKSSSSASVGLGGIGSVSLPFSSGSEALVKVGSETIASDKFYDSFFELVRKYLADDSAKAE